MSSIKLSSEELEDLTGFKLATKQLKVLHNRGFLRAFIDRNGDVVLERTHYEAVSSGAQVQTAGPAKVANLDFLKKRA